MFRVLSPFDYEEPKTVAEAAGILVSAGSKGAVLAGGLTLIDNMKKGKVKPDVVVALGCIPDLNHLEIDEDGCLRIGALATIRDLERFSEADQKFTALFEAASQIASVQVKTMGTVVGNVCVGTPASDLVPPLIASGAEVKISGPENSSKKMLLEDIYQDHRLTVLKFGEIVTELVVPPLKPGMTSAFLNLLRSKSDIPKVSVAVNVTVKDGICEMARIALGAVAPTIVRAKAAEDKILGKRIDDAAINAAVEAVAANGVIDPITDIRSTADYRKEMAAQLVKRALIKCLDNLKSQGMS